MEARSVCSVNICSLILLAKDRVTGRNPIVPLHMLDNYYKKLLQELEQDLLQEIER